MELDFDQEKRRCMGPCRCTENVLECSRSNCRGRQMSGRVPTVAINPGWPVLAARLCVCLLVLAAILPGPASGEPRGEPKRVLMLHSFGRDFLPRSAFALTIRTELEQQSPWPLELQEHNLLPARFNNPGPEAPFVDYLRSLYSGRPPDIVVSIGAPAAPTAAPAARSDSGNTSLPSPPCPEIPGRWCCHRSPSGRTGHLKA